MPLGDPQGGLFEYTDEGLPKAVYACTIPCRDPRRSAAFYTDVLGMELLGQTDAEAYLVREGCRIILRRSDDAGIDTGLYFAVSSPYDSRRRLMDEGVVFENPPERTPFGTRTSIRDDDGNIIHLIESGAEFQL